MYLILRTKLKQYQNKTTKCIKICEYLRVYNHNETYRGNERNNKGDQKSFIHAS